MLIILIHSIEKGVSELPQYITRYTKFAQKVFFFKIINFKGKAVDPKF